MDRSTRRQFLQSTAAMAAAGAVPYWFTGELAKADEAKAINDRPRIAGIGVGGQGSHDLRLAANFGDVVAVCDADLERAEAASAAYGGKPAVFQDYRKLLERKDIDVIINGTPDHWHTAVNLAALRAGKDIYTEKPLTLTVEEGKLFRKTVQETGRIVQVGTQQRSEAQFRTACELVRNGRIGKLQQVWVLLPFWSTKGGPFATKPVPAKLNWDLYQGQAPEHVYCPERTHSVFRWWSEYAGGIITDWGQHHMDIAYWGMNLEQSGPLSVEGKCYFPNAGKADCFNTPDRFTARMQFPGDIELFYVGVRDEGYMDSMKKGDISEKDDAALFQDLPPEVKKEQRNGIMFIGDNGRVFVNRGGIYGKAVDELKENPLGSDAVRLYHSDNHMGNFFECVKSRKPTISTVDVAHRVITACHLTNIAIRLGRPIRWDSGKEQIIGDDEANQSKFMARPQRSPYKIG